MVRSRYDGQRFPIKVTAVGRVGCLIRADPNCARRDPVNRNCWIDVRSDPQLRVPRSTARFRDKFLVTLVTGQFPACFIRVHKRSNDAHHDERNDRFHFSPPIQGAKSSNFV